MTDFDWDLFFRYRANACTAEERERFEQSLAADPARQQLADAAILAAAGIARRGRSRAGAVHERGPFSNGPYKGRYAWRVGLAAALLTATVGIATWPFLRHRPTPAPTIPPPERSIATRPGERADIQLPDGTHVILGPASLLRYAAATLTTAGHPRDVALTGEAFFNVVHDTTRPFRVHARGTTTEDVGTAFDLRAYEADSAVQVVVAAGAVSVRATLHPAPVVLGRGTLGLVEHEGDVKITPNIALDRFIAWTKGQLVFTNTPLPLALRDLGRWFDLDIQLGSPRLATRSLTATFADDPIPDVLRAIDDALDVRAERDGRRVTLYPR